MKQFNIGDIIIGEVTGIEKYGIFVNIDDLYSGLIHISEVSDKFVSNLNDYVKIGENIKVKIIEKNDDNHHLKLSIKNIDYIIDKKKHTKIAETEKGFNTLRENIPIWIDKKIQQIKGNN